MHKPPNSGSKHFVPHALAEGILAAIAEDGGAAICNAGLIDLGGQIIVFDTFLTPQAAADLRQYAIEKYRCAPQIVINSHYHNDHTWGNQVFAADAQIISSAHTRALISTAGMEEFQWYSANAAQRLESLRAQLQNANDEAQQKQFLLWMGYYAGLVEALPSLTVCLPGITFDRQLEIHGTRRTAQLITFENAHTGSDTVLYLPQEEIVFMSDLLFVGCHPYLADGDPQQLLKALRELSELDAARLVPGHGPIGTIEDLKLLLAYIEQSYEIAQTLIETGNVSEERIRTLPIPDRYQHWQQPQFYQANMNFICDRLSSPNGSRKI